MAVFAAKISSALALIATSICKAIVPQCPPSSEMTCAESTGSPTTCDGSKSVANMVSSGLVRPIVSTTSNNAMPATFLRGVFITGDNCEILSRPEKARNEPAKPTRSAGRVSF